jgi:peptide/nickel transport system permease protein
MAAMKKRIKNMVMGWRKLFKQNWTLFKASKIGLLGLFIMITFLVIAFAAPFMGLRDPLWWRAPDMDIVQVTKYWPYSANNSDKFGFQPINHSAAVRVVPKAFGIATDRLYVAAGSRLYAIKQEDGLKAWTNYIEFGSTISADPMVVNWGKIDNPSEANFTVYVGTQSGAVYAVNDKKNPGQPPPSSQLIGVANGSVTGIAVFSGDDGPDHSIYDLVAVSSSSGRMYFWQVTDLPIAHIGPSVFNVSAKPVHVAGQPMKGTGSYPLFSPAFYYTTNNRTRPFICVGSEDGMLTAIDITNVSSPELKWSWQVAKDGEFSSAPVVHFVSSRPKIFEPVVFAGMDDGNLTARYASNGSSLPWWLDLLSPSRRIRWGGLTQVETGKLTQPFLVGETLNLLVGSASGYAYSIGYMDVTAGYQSIAPNWVFRDVVHAVGTTYISSYPFAFIKTLVYVSSNFEQGAPGPVDDVGTIFALNYNDGTTSWSQTFDSAILGSPVALTGESRGLDQVYLETVAGSTYAYSTTGLYMIPAPPSWVQSYKSGNLYILGLDNRGRDIWSQWVWGSRIALYVGFLAATFSITIGTTMGLVAGYFGGKIDTVLMRFTDVILVIPGLPLIITLASVLGASVNNLILVIAIVGWPGVARVIRSQVLSLKERPFIESARVTGASHARIMGKHILPNVLPLAFLYMTFAVSGAILSEASISFIGLGDIQTVSWGRMLQDVTQSQALKAWWWLIPPGIAITLVSLGFFLIGRAFDEIVNPRLRKR